jgi:uncharacterized membrane protein
MPEFEQPPPRRAATRENVRVRQPEPDRHVSSPARTIARLGLGAFLAFTGFAHCTFARSALHAQVPPWLPLNADFVILASGVAEILLGAGLIVLTRWRAPVGWLVALFFVLIFPGNISQFITHTAAFGLNSDLSRGIRLLLQPLLVVWALWCTGAWGTRRRCSEVT